MSVLSAGLMALAATAAPPVCDIRDHGAISGDGVHDTPAIQAAVEQCAGTGGTVMVPAGDWSTGTVRLGSAMTLHLAEGAVLALHPDIALFPEVEIARDADITAARAALLADGVSGLNITGTGRIEGNGAAFWDEDFYATGLARPTLPRPGPVIELANCRDTHVAGITLTNLPAYALRFHRCDGVSARGVTIRNDPRSPNTDGIQIRDTSNAVISGVDIRTGDDAIVLKSGDRPVDNVLVENSYLESDDAALKFGTGSRVGVTNSVFRNLTIANSRYGIALFMIDGGAHRSNLFEDISITTGGRHPRPFPIFIDIDRREADRRYGRIIDTTFRRLTITTSGASLIAGNPAAPIEGLVFEDVSIAVKDAFDVTRRSAKPRGNVQIAAQAGSTDYSTRPAHLVLAHVRGLVMERVTFSQAAPADRRQALIEIDVTRQGAGDGTP
jgi:hypothetical protein